MKNIFTKENMITFGLVALACATAILVVVPLARKFVPSLKKPAATVTPAPTS